MLIVLETSFVLKFLKIEQCGSWYEARYAKSF